MSTRTAVYRFYDDDGILLYVGMTGNLAQRRRVHSQIQPWWPAVTHEDVRWFIDRSTASAAEQRGIETEAPLYNRMQPPWNTPVQRPVDDNGAAEERGARARHRVATTRMERASRELRAAALQAFANGVPPAEIVRATGYSSEQIRRISPPRPVRRDDRD